MATGNQANKVIVNEILWFKKNIFVYFIFFQIKLKAEDVAPIHDDILIAKMNTGQVRRNLFWMSK